MPTGPKYQNMCPFMVQHYGVFLMFLVLFGFGKFAPRERKCIGGRCALWNPEHSICSFRLIGQ